MGIPNIREFNPQDWNGYAGAERFTDGSEPLICDTDTCTILCDNNGVEVDFEDRIYFVTMATNPETLTPELWTQEIAKLVVANLAKTFSHKTAEEAMRYCDDHNWAHIEI